MLALGNKARYCLRVISY